jgi:hypothetical protein
VAGVMSGKQAVEEALSAKVRAEPVNPSWARDSHRFTPSPARIRSTASVSVVPRVTVAR